MAACSKQGMSPREKELLVEQYEAESVHRERTSFRNIYKRLYENEEAVTRYCGQAETVDETSGEKTWPQDCYKRLERIFWARLRIAYPYTDWARVNLECDAFPEKCRVPEGVEKLVHASNWDQSGKALETDFKRLQENYEFGDNDCVMSSFAVGSSATVGSSTTKGTDQQSGQVYSDPSGGGSVTTRGSQQSETNGSAASSWASAGRTTVRCRTTTRE